MRRMLVALVVVSLACFYLMFSLLEASTNKEYQSDASRQGVLDLTDWDVQSNRVIPLDGQWEFYWNRLLEPGKAPDSAPAFLQVPGFWRKHPDVAKDHAKGAATYRLIIKVKPSSTVYGMRVSNIRMASTVYVNGEKVGASGVPALTSNEYKYENKPFSSYFSIQGDMAEIIIHAADYENSQGGIPYRLYFGSAQGIQKYNSNIMILNMTLIVSLLMLGCYQLSVFIIRKEEKSLLYFGLSCIVIAWAFASNGDRILIEYFDLPREMYYKIQAISLYSSLITMVMFIETMCKGLIPRWFMKSTIFGMGGYIVFVLLTPFQWYSNFNIVASTFQIMIFMAIIGKMLHSYWNGRYGEFNKKSMALFILAICCFSFGLIDFALYLSSVVFDYKLGYCAFLSFCLLASFILSYRFSEAYRTIEGMASKLKQADKQKDDFLLQTSHEFQTPLHGIINLSQSMLDSEAEELSAKHIQNLSMIRDTSRRLSSLVHDILDLEKIKRNELSVHPAPVDVRMAASLVFDLFQHLMAGKKIRLVNAVPDNFPLVYADENRLKQIIHNLVGNAVKFTQSGTITISAQIMEGQAIIKVEDTGVGIPQADWEAVFQPFEQAHSPYEYGGTGLGLFICRRLMHLMNGTIYVDWSEADRGTGIAFTLPLMKDDGLSRVPEAGPVVAKKPVDEPRTMEDYPSHVKGAFTLLAVDDEPSNLQVISRLFDHEQYNLLWATNGLEALELLKNRTDIDLVLLDVMMPRMSGYDVCREIRKQYSLFELPIILLTALHTSDDMAAGFKAGANDFIIKPFDALEVRARTETLLQLKRSVEATLRAELDFLQSQIKPHFLFNSLNSIMALCRTDPFRAEKLITHLSNYLRRSFDPRPDSFVLLQDELQLVEAYVEIEKARFEERLTVVYDIHQEALGRRILPLTIQPLVENAIRHGIMKKEDGGTVRLTIHLDGDAIFVEVWDNGIGIPREQLDNLWSNEILSSSRRGVGLFNIQRRLAHFCREELRIESEAGEWTKVSFQFKV